MAQIAQDGFCMHRLQPLPSVLDDNWILAQRPPRHSVDPHRPYAVLVEPERSRDGCVDDVLTVFLSNRECPFRCLMCDLWRNTTLQRVPEGAIVEQVAFALSSSRPARHIKLYNAGNFFDAQAIPPADLPALAELLCPFQTVIVENHPRLVDHRCLAFRDRLAGRLEVAMGLETIHPDVLPRLNKRMTLDDFERAVRLLTAHGIGTRAFVLLRPPFLDEAEGLHWACRSLDWAFSIGVECCVVIPTRAGNGALDVLQQHGQFAPPTLASLEAVLAYGLSLAKGRTFVDLWDIDKLYDCGRCGPLRRQRLEAMNHRQQWLPPVSCECEGNPCRL